MDNQMFTIALAGNPNVGKSTVFNALTGMHQHTGNWSGKTVDLAQGTFTYDNRIFSIVDLPGTYSLLSSSKEEQIARDYICFNDYDAVVIVADAVCLERNLNLVLQILELTGKAILCVNLMDEAEKKNIYVKIEQLSEILKIPVVATSARSKTGLDELQKEIKALAETEKTAIPSVIEYDFRLLSATEALVSLLQKNSPSSEFAAWAGLRLPENDRELNRKIYAHLKLTEAEICKAEEAIVAANIRLSSDGISSSIYRDLIVNNIMNSASEIYNKCVNIGKSNYNQLDRKLDKLFTSKATGYPIMLFMLCTIFWITIVGANYPSQCLSLMFGSLETPLREFFLNIKASPILTGFLLDGIYKTLTWVVSVMLPPMAIFFPLFTLLEDSGYLPRIAFNLDKYFRKACAHGKQSLTMCMGFGCNACGVIGCRIIDSPRERMLAMLTNTFVPCNGRFPGLIALISMFFIGSSTGLFKSFKAAALLCAVILFGIFITLIISKILSHTLLKGMPSSFVLELPPYRRPQFAQVIIRSVLDRTLFVLCRAVVVAAPAGGIIWIMANISVGEASVLTICTDFLDPFARMLGLDGVILMAFILGWPANEIVIPIIIMTYMASGTLMDYSSLAELKALFVDNGWTISTAVCTILFSLTHFPCATTCLTIRKESGSFKWMALAFAIPAATGVVVCLFANTLMRIFI